MNIQVNLENGNHFEVRIISQEEEIKNLKNKLSELTETINGMHDVIHQLVGGLYCQKTQSEIIYQHLNCLGFEDYAKNINKDKNTHPFDYYPTTRQGDDNSERIRIIEQKLESLKK